jgi:hypothetical protein
MVLVVRIGEAPGKLAADNTRLIEVRADDGEREEWGLLLLDLFLGFVTTDHRETLRVGGGRGRQFRWLGRGSN